MENLYEILDCETFCSVDDVKKKFQSLVLRHHPDKCAEDASATEMQTIQDINRAWSVLKDPDSKKKYDSELRCQLDQAEGPVLARLSPEELTASGEKDRFSYPCRCGAEYVVYLDREDESIHTETLYECEHCSFSIIVETVSKHPRPDVKS